jgi:hypothetical protein
MCNFRIYTSTILYAVIYFYIRINGAFRNNVPLYETKNYVLSSGVKKKEETETQNPTKLQSEISNGTI